MVTWCIPHPTWGHCKFKLPLALGLVPYICGMHYTYVLTIIFSAHNTFYDVVSVMPYLSILRLECLLHTVSPLLKTYLQPLPTKASSTPAPPATFRRRWSVIHRVVSSLTAGQFPGAVTSGFSTVECKKARSLLIRYDIIKAKRDHE